MPQKLSKNNSKKRKGETYKEFNKKEIKMTWLAKPPKTKELTKHEREILKSLPDGWFGPYDIPYPRFKRPDYFLERLVVKGIIESSVIDGRWIFHKIVGQLSKE